MCSGCDTSANPFLASLRLMEKGFCLPAMLFLPLVCLARRCEFFWNGRDLGKDRQERWGGRKGKKQQSEKVTDGQRAGIGRLGLKG